MANSPLLWIHFPPSIAICKAVLLVEPGKGCRHTMGGKGNCRRRRKIINQQAVSRPPATGKNKKIILLFWDGYGNKSNYEKLLARLPGEDKDYLRILVPNFTGPLQGDGRFGYSFDSAAIPAYLTALGHSHGALVVPMVLGSGPSANNMLLNPDKRANFTAGVLKVVRQTQADGFLVDLEGIAANTGPGLTALMKELASLLHAEGKLAMVAVMARTSAGAEPWNRQYEYAELAKYADYVQIMAYDYHHAGSGPGPVAPPAWVEKVVRYAVSQIPSNKILLGIPAYGRSWCHKGAKWVVSHLSMAKARQTAGKYGVPIKYEVTSDFNSEDDLGIPMFSHRDEKGVQWTTYFEDGRSWQVKLALADKYNLGGIAVWSMHWLDAASAPEFFALMK